MKEVKEEEEEEEEEEVEEENSDISGYHSDSDSTVMMSGNSPFISKTARYNFLSRSGTVFIPKPKKDIEFKKLHISDWLLEISNNQYEIFNACAHIRYQIGLENIHKFWSHARSCSPAEWTDT